MPKLPRRLNLGDTLGLILPASAPADPASIDQAIALFEKLGFKILLGKHGRERNGFLAGDDRSRASDVMSMFKNRKIQGIVCFRGGYGTPRILPMLDYEVIRENPKVFIGFSDISALHCAFLKKSNLVSFHGPNGASLSEENVPKFTLSSWLKSLMQPTAYGRIIQGCPDADIQIVRKGKAVGGLVGGNLALVSSLVGTGYLPSFKDKILFLEDVGEAPYRMDRMLTQLLNAGLMEGVKGVAIGRCHDCSDNRTNPSGEYRQTVDDVFVERFGRLKIPMVMGLPFGHVSLNATLPVGVKAELDATKGDLIILEPAVS